MKRLFVLQHVACEPLGILAEELRRWHAPYHVVEIWKGNAFPEIKDTLAVIVLGGPMNVGEIAQYPDLVPETAYLAALVKAHVPMLGVCLGSQLLASVLGAQVAPGPAPEIGYSSVTLTPEGAEDRLLSGFPMDLPVFQWHGQGFELPAGAIRLATSSLYPNQAFRHGRVWGFQFHLEATPDLVSAWCREYTKDLAAAGMKDLDVVNPAEPASAMVSMYGRQVIRRFWDTVTEM